MLDSPVVSAGRVLRAAQAVIFDVEGTLLDSVPATLQSWQEVLRAFGHEVSRSQLQELSGRDTDELLAELLPQVPEATRTRIGKEQGRHYRACYLDNVGPFRASRKCLPSFAKRANVLRLAPVVSATNSIIILQSPAAATSSIISRAAMTPGAANPIPIYSRSRCAGSESRRARRSSLGTPYDAQAAAAVGLPAIGVLTGGFSASDLRWAGCVDVVEAVTDLGASDEKVRS
jgi:phosphoglycolate phosphatase-like HAD superfamily hydrolase